MRQRQFNATDLRMMMEDAAELVPGGDPGRWVAVTHFHGDAWKIVLEPNFTQNTITVVTAFQVF